VIILASLVGFLLIALVVLGMVSFYISRTVSPAMPPPEPPRATTPPPRGEGAPGGVIVPHPPVPPVPPTPPAIGNSAISREMVYPGSEITMELNGGEEGGSVIQLRTTDPLDKVVAWYKEKIKPVKTVNMIGPVTVLRGEGMAAIITGGGDGVSIVLKQERTRN
jgi:hypothetical protein